MNCLFEESDLLNNPIECFNFSSESEYFPVRPHWHYFMEMIFMTEGTAEMREGNSVHLLSEGCMILFHPKAVHSIYSADGSPVRYMVLKFDINRMNGTSTYSPKLRSIFRCAEKKDMNVFFGADEAEKMGASEIFSKCISEMNTQKYGYDLVIRSELYKLLVEIIRCWQEQGFKVDSEAYAEDSRYDIYSITEYIDANMSSNIKVTDIADICGMSYSYFAKKFLSVYGKTCKEYMEDMRIYKVEEFLAFTDFDLTYISQETGFSDCSHMIKSFKARHGITPKQFRKMKQNRS